MAVALNSSRNGLVALLIANNFVEIKSTVFKKWDSTRIWALVCAVSDWLKVAWMGAAAEL